MLSFTGAFFSSTLFRNISLRPRHTTGLHLLEIVQANCRRQDSQNTDSRLRHLVHLLGFIHAYKRSGMDIPHGKLYRLNVYKKKVAKRLQRTYSRG